MRKRIHMTSEFKSSSSKQSVGSWIGALIHGAIWSPNLLREMLKTQPLTDKKFRLAYRLLWYGISLLFGIYAFYYAYKSTIWHLAGNSPLKPIEFILNFISMLAIVMVLLLLWRGLDRVGFQFIGKFFKDPHNAFPMLETVALIPLLFLVPIFSFERMAFNGTYLQWGLSSIPIFNIVVVIGWHYLSLAYFGGVWVEPAQNQKKFKIFLLGMVFINILIIGLMVGYLPGVFQAEPIEFLRQMF
jgi:hypothetical protein